MLFPGGLVGPGEGFEVLMVPGASLQCFEGVFIRFSSIPGVSGKFNICVGASGVLRSFPVSRSSNWSAGVGWSLEY